MMRSRASILIHVRDPSNILMGIISGVNRPLQLEGSAPSLISIEHHRSMGGTSGDRMQLRKCTLGYFQHDHNNSRE